MIDLIVHFTRKWMEVVMFTRYTGWLSKNGTAYFPQYVNAITDNSIEVASPEENDTKISNFGSVVRFVGHILWDNVEAPKFPFSA